MPRKKQLNEADIVDVLRKIADQRRKEGKPMADKFGNVVRTRIPGTKIAPIKAWKALEDAQDSLDKLKDKLPSTHRNAKKNFTKAADAAYKKIEVISKELTLKRSTKAKRKTKTKPAIPAKTDTAFKLLEHNSDEKHLIAEADIVDVLRKIANERRSEKGREAVKEIIPILSEALKEWEKATGDWQKSWVDIKDANGKELAKNKKLNDAANWLFDLADALSEAMITYMMEIYQRAVDQETVNMGDYTPGEDSWEDMKRRKKRDGGLFIKEGTRITKTKLKEITVVQLLFLILFLQSATGHITQQFQWRFTVHIRFYET